MPVARKFFSCVDPLYARNGRQFRNKVVRPKRTSVYTSEVKAHVVLQHQRKYWRRPCGRYVMIRHRLSIKKKELYFPRPSALSGTNFRRTIAKLESETIF